MSEYKFACPVCGQHITTDARLRITQMECPTCFRKLHVPPEPAAGSPGLVLSTSEVSTRQVPLPGASEKTVVPEAPKKFPVIPIVIVAVLCAAGAGAFIFRDKIFKSAQSKPVEPTNNAVAKKKSKPGPPAYKPPADDPNYTLNLAGMKIPEATVTGRINGHAFTLEKATLTGGSLTFRQGGGKVADLGLTLVFAVQAGQELAGQNFNIESDVDKAAKLTLRWKDESDPEKSVTKNYTKGYALRLEFGAVNGKRLAGKIYLCAPDKAHSYVAGTFEADIRKPAAPKTVTPKPKPKN